MEEEATFSDDDIADPPGHPAKATTAIPSNDPRARKTAPTSPSPRGSKRKLSTETADVSAPSSAKIVRPTFKPLEDVLYRDEPDELLIHPDFM